MLVFERNQTIIHSEIKLVAPRTPSHLLHATIRLCATNHLDERCAVRLERVAHSDGCTLFGYLKLLFVIINIMIIIVFINFIIICYCYCCCVIVVVIVIFVVFV